MSISAKEYLTEKKIEDFLKYLEEQGRSRLSLESYRRILMGMYNYLPEDKEVDQEAGFRWKTFLEEQGFSCATMDTRISVWNSLMRYLGRREWQISDFYRESTGEQPELSRAEYLRLLSAAKNTGREKSYLLIKTLGGAGMRIQELPQLTVEALKKGEVGLESHNSHTKRYLHLPEGLRGELLAYVKREGIARGPVFSTAEGIPMARSSVNYHISIVSQDAKVREEKATPRCLWKMHQDTFVEIRAEMDVLVEQTYQKMLEKEQMIFGWAD